MFVTTDKQETLNRSIEIDLVELRYLLSEVYGLELPTLLDIQFSISADNNPNFERDTKISIQWKEEVKENFSTLVLSKSVSDYAMEMHKIVDHKLYPTAEDLVKASIENALNEDKAKKKKGKRENAKHSKNK